MKRIACCALAAVLLVALSACGVQKSTEEEQPQAQVVNPLEESSFDEVKEATGIALKAPDGASEVQYFVYKLENPLAEMRYVRDGHRMNLRAQKTELTSFPYSGEELVNAVQEGKVLEGESTDISGMYCEWKTFATQDVGTCEAQSIRADDIGCIAWIDVENGILYNLAMPEGATDEGLVTEAELVYQAQ